jgi:hypothetical protein
VVIHELKPLEQHLNEYVVRSLISDRSIVDLKLVLYAATKSSDVL